MGEAALAGFVGASSLILGALLGLYVKATARYIPYIMAFGAGVLISALSFELTEDAFTRGGFDAVGVGLAIGAVLFVAIDRMVLHRLGGANRKRSGGQQEEGAPVGIVVGTILDGIPESIAIGVAVFEHGAVTMALLAGVFLSNIPESLSSATGLMRTTMHSQAWKVIVLWVAVAIAAAIAAALGYGVVARFAPDALPFIQALAAGAILAMLVDTMIPEAFEQSDRDALGLIGLWAVLGYALSFFLTKLGSAG